MTQVSPSVIILSVPVPFSPVGFAREPAAGGTHLRTILWSNCVYRFISQLSEATAMLGGRPFTSGHAVSRNNCGRRAHLSFRLVHWIWRRASPRYKYPQKRTLSRKRFFISLFFFLNWIISLRFKTLHHSSSTRRFNLIFYELISIRRGIYKRELY